MPIEKVEIREESSAGNHRHLYIRQSTGVHLVAVEICKQGCITEYQRPVESKRVTTFFDMLEKVKKPEAPPMIASLDGEHYYLAISNWIEIKEYKWWLNSDQENRELSTLVRRLLRVFC